MPAWQLLPPETAHALAIWALRRGLAPTVTPPASPRLRSAFCGFKLPHPLGLAAGFDKNAVAVSGLFGAGFQLRRGRHRDAAAAGRQPPTAAVPSARAAGADQPHGLQQRRAGRRARAARGAGSVPGPARRQHRRQPRRRGPGRRLRRLPARAVRAGRLSHGQRVVAEHAGAARSAGPGADRRAARRRWSRRAALSPAAADQSRCCSRSLRIWSRTPRQGLPRWRSRATSTA